MIDAICDGVGKKRSAVMEDVGLEGDEAAKVCRCGCMWVSGWVGVGVGGGRPAHPEPNIMMIARFRLCVTALQLLVLVVPFPAS